MKKGLFFVLVLLLIPIIANAEEGYCTIISGTGKDIGDEIACGTEHFYVIDNDGTNTKMLAKYNLYVGYNYYRTEIFKTTNQYTDSDSWSEVETEMRNKCLSVDNHYEYNYVDTNSDNTVNYYCYAYEAMDSNYPVQDKKAIGAHGGTSGNPEFPEYGIVKLDKEIPYPSDKTPQIGDKIYDFDFAEWDEDAQEYIKKELSYLTDYKNSLKKQNIEIEAINILTLNEIDEIVKKVSGNNLPLDTWLGANWEEIENGHPNSLSTYRIGSIKEKVDKKYSWLWSTTYWTKTMKVSGRNGDVINGYVYFVDTLGDLCSYLNCGGAVGAGIRPVITMPNSKVLMVESSQESKEITPPQKETQKKEKNPDTKDIAIYLLIVIALISAFIYVTAKDKVNKRRI